MFDKTTIDRNMKPSQDIFEEIQSVYEALNWHLFEDELPNCVLSLQRRKNSYGYFVPERFQRKDGMRCNEIVLNPDHYDPENPKVFSQHLGMKWCIYGSIILASRVEVIITIDNGLRR